VGHEQLINAGKVESVEKQVSAALHQPRQGLRFPLHPVNKIREGLGNRAFGQFIQAKLKVSQPGDPYEQEADRVADQVLRMPDMATERVAVSRLVSPTHQRACSKCEEDDENKDIHRKAADDDEERHLQAKSIQGGAKTPADGAGVNDLKGGGAPLSDATRAYFEPRFGHEFGQVRVHTDAAAAASARSFGALAYTVGSDLVFGKGQYEPETSEGKHLLAHELTHVLQQRSAGRPSSPAEPQRAATTARGILEDELDDFFCNVSNAWPAIRLSPQTVRDGIRADQVMERNIRRRASAKDLLKTYLLLNYQTEASYPAHYAAFIEATDRAGTHEARIYSILRGVTQAERVHMQQMPGLVEVLEDEMSGSDLQLALGLLYGRETQAGVSTSAPRTSTHLERGGHYDLEQSARDGFEDVQRVMENALSSGGLNGDVVLDDTPLWAQYADHFDPEEVWYLRMIARYRGPRHFPRIAGAATSFVTAIWDAVRPVGTDEEVLIGQLNALNNATSLTEGGGRTLASPPREEVKADRWFVPMLNSELSGGDLRQALAAVSATQTPQVGIRNALENAIDHKNMVRIRELLRDPTLSQADRTALRNDPVILDEMGEELNGIQLCEVTQLLIHGAAGPSALVSGLTAFFTPTLRVPNAIAYLQGLSSADQNAMLREPGVYFLLVDRNLDYLTYDQRNQLLAAVRSKDPAWQTPGSAGTHRTHVESVQATLPASFTSSEARIQLRLNLDQSRLPANDRIESGTIEDWTREIDDVWNGKYRVRSGARRLDLVFDPYIAPGIAPPRIGLFLDPGNRRSYTTGAGDEIHLFVQGSSFKSTVLAHELGHILGNPDEYSLPPSEYQRLTGTAGTSPAPRGGQDVAGLMGAHYESEAIATRHVAPAIDILNNTRNLAEFPDPFVPEPR
jgi:hypothetical protein